MSVVAATLVTAFSRFLSLYFVLLIVRILLSWFPNIDWSNPVFSTISQLTDPYLNLFRSIIPPIGGLDLSAILAILALQVITGLVDAAGSELVALSYSYGTF
ncbi:MAG: YggT family protein [Cyanobacteria bacterium P01_F01_bin.53]